MTHRRHLRARRAGPPRAPQPARRARRAPGQRRRRDPRAAARPPRAVTALIDGRPGVALEQIHPGGVFEGVIEDAELPLRYQLEVDYGDAGRFTIDDPVRVPAHARRARPVPDRRGPPRGALRAARRARPRARGRRRHRVRGLGARPLARSASSATSTPGTAACTRCARSARPASGSCSCPASARARATSTRSSPGSRAPAQGRPVRPGHRGPAEDRLGRVRAAARLERAGRRVAAPASAAPARCGPDLDLRGPPRLVAAEPLEGQPLADLPRARRRAVRATSRTWASRTSSCCR